MTLDTAAGSGDTPSSKRSAKVLDTAWRGAAAYHYYLLAQRQLYRGQLDDAMKTSLRLGEYDDVLPPRDIYSLIALAAYHNKHYGVCSRAFVKLETMPGLSAAQADQLQTLALAVFTKHSPLDPDALPQPYLDCLEQGTPFAACTASGQLMEDGGRRGAFVCRTCRYPCLERAIQALATCPLCHTPLEGGFTNRAV
jgi:WD repeat-containing protein 35